MLPFIAIHLDHIGEETDLRDLFKQTAPCWTRAIYTSMTLAPLVWQRYYLTLNAEDRLATHEHLPKDWRADPLVAAEIMRCPFCTSIYEGDLEHLHLFCTTPILQQLREQCYERIENALHNLYSFDHQNERTSTEHINSSASSVSRLQSALEKNARKQELVERPIVLKKQVIMESRPINTAILTEFELRLAIQTQRASQWKLEEYLQYPLSHRCGLIHCLEEANLNLARATICDISYLGAIPKTAMQILHCFRPNNSTEHHHIQDEYWHLVKKLTSAVLWRPTIIQKAITYLLAREKRTLHTTFSNITPNNDTVSTTSRQNTSSKSLPRQKTSDQQNNHHTHATQQKLCNGENAKYY